MSGTDVCPSCGKPILPNAPESLCPACLIQLAVTSVPNAPTGRSAPATIEELRSHFPSLDVQEIIGQGGMGCVYRVLQRSLGRPLALKVLSPSLVGDAIFCERFNREATAMAKLNHPNIVAVHDSGRAGDYLFILMDLVEGITLRELLQHGRLSASESLRIIPQICDALQYAHDRGVVHRDIKPENILIDQDGNARLVDFGLAKLADPGIQQVTLTEVNARLGTPRYMAPEQFKNTAKSDHRSDIYSVGVLFYEMLTGDVPSPDFRRPSTFEGVDPRVDSVVERTLKNSPEDRYQRVVEVKTEVERIARTRPDFFKVQNPRLFLMVTMLATFALVLFLARPKDQTVPGTVPLNPPLPESKPDAPPGTTPPLAERWSQPVNLGPQVNSPDDDGGPALSSDSRILMFHSRRPGGSGETDLWVAERPSLNAPFGKAVNAGPRLNTAEHDGKPALADQGRLLVFVSHRDGTIGGADLWMSRRSSVQEPWSEPVNLGEPINTEGPEQRPSLSEDGLTLVYTSALQGPMIARRRKITDSFGSPSELRLPQVVPQIRLPVMSGDERVLVCERQIRRNSLWIWRRPNPSQPFDQILSLGEAVNTPALYASPTVSHDGNQIIFASDREGTEGHFDLWETRRLP